MKINAYSISLYYKNEAGWLPTDVINTMTYYWLRWVNTRGEHGPWSVTASSIIVG